MTYLNWLNKLNKNITYLVACSGGPDSMFLLDNLVKNDFKVIVCHVNYHKRFSSNVDQEILEDYCEANKLVLEIKEVQKDEYNKTNFQDQARILRYNFFNEIANKYQTYNIVIAHHIYDLLETYLIQKQRKAIVSYYGLKFKSTYKNLTVYRPMLELRKEDIYDYLNLNRIKYGFDETNELTIYERNKIRQQKISKLTDLDINLMLGEIKELNSELELMKDKLEVIYNSVISNNFLSVSEFLKYNDNLQLQQMIIYELLSNYDEILVFKVKKSKIKEVVRVLSNSQKPNILISLGEGAYLVKEYNNAYVAKRSEFKDYKYNIKKIGNYSFPEVTIYDKKPKGEKNVQEIFVQPKDFPLTIQVSSCQQEVSVHFGTKKIRRLFIDNKIPFRQRAVWPVIVNTNNEIVCVPGLAISREYTGENPNLFIVNRIPEISTKK